MDKSMNVTVALRGVDSLSPKLKQAIDRVNDLSGRVKQASTRLKDIAITQAQIRSIDTAKGKMRDLGNQIKVAETNMRTTAAAMRIGGATQVDLDKATRAVERLKTEYQALGREAMATRQKLTAKGITGSLDGARAGLESERQAMLSELRRHEALQSARTRADRMRSRAGTAAAAGASMLLPGLAITSGLYSDVTAAGEWTAELRQIAITADMTDERMQALGRTIMRTSDIVAQSTEALTSGVGYLIAAGMSNELAERSIAAIGKTATAYKADILEIAQTAFVLNDALGILPERLQGAMAIIARAGKEGNVELRDMARVVPTLASSLVALKMQGNEAVATLGAALQIARKGAPNADVAATNLQNFLSKILSPETLKKAQDNFGLDLYKVITDAQVNGKNPIEAALEAIGRVTKGGDQKLLGDLFQDMQVQGFLRPMLQNMDEYRRIKAEALGAASGAMIDSDFARVVGDVDVSTQRLSNAWTALKIMTGTALAPALLPVVNMLSRGATAMVRFAERHPKLVQWMAALAGVIGILLVVGGSLALGLAAILIPMAGLSVAAATLGIGLLPLIGLIAAVGAAVAATVAVFVRWGDEIGDWLSTLWDLMKKGDWVGIGSHILNGFLDAWTVVIKGVWAVMGVEMPKLGAAIADALKDGFLQAMTINFQIIYGMLTGLGKRIAQALKDALGIRSPSRVFAEIGMYSTEGLAAGLMRGTPTVVQTAAEMAGRVSVAGVPRFAAAGAGSGGAGAGSVGMSIGNVQIVIDGATGSPEAIAKAVEDRLRKMDQQQRTAAAARFYED